MYGHDSSCLTFSTTQTLSLAGSLRSGPTLGRNLFGERINCIFFGLSGPVQLHEIRTHEQECQGVRYIPIPYDNIYITRLVCLRPWPIRTHSSRIKTGWSDLLNLCMAAEQSLFLLSTPEPLLPIWTTHQWKSVSTIAIAVEQSWNSFVDANRSWRMWKRMLGVVRVRTEYALCSDLMRKNL